MRVGCVLTLLLTVGGVGSAQPSPQTDSQLPAELATQLQQLRCAVPLESVIRGEFARPRATDWAVLCETGMITTLFVFRTDSGLRPDQLRKTLHGDGQHLSTWTIMRVDKKYIAAHCRKAHGKLPPIDHQGILDTFNVPVVHYYHRGEWLDPAVTEQ